MFTAMIDNGGTLQNVYTPLPFTAHLVFCIIATAVYCTQYYRRGSLHYLMLALAVDATFLTQVNTSAIFIACLGIVEIALLVAALVYYIKFAKQLKAKNAERDKRIKQAEEAKKSAEKAFDSKDTVESAFDDKNTL